jgi:hypothetical protein
MGTWDRRTYFNVSEDSKVEVKNTAYRSFEALVPKL